MKFEKNRVEAISDGVVAIIITIMVLDIPLPKEIRFNDIIPFIASILVFFISFFLVAVYWTMHYRLFSHLNNINNKIVWRNFLLLFSLSLMPIFTKWVLQDFGKVVPAIGYALLFIFVNISFQFLFSAIMKEERMNEKMEDIEKQTKIDRRSYIIRLGIIMLIFIGLIAISFFLPKISSLFLIGMPIIASISNFGKNIKKK